MSLVPLAICYVDVGVGAPPPKATIVDDLTKIRSIVEILSCLGSTSHASSLLKDIDFHIIYVRYLPCEFNGDINIV